MRIVFVAPFLLLLTACPANSNNSGADAASGTPDAAVASIDASPSAPDASVPTIDAAVPTIDAFIPMPDAAAPIDAPLDMPDATPAIDAPLPPDAPVDAPPPPDAATIDAPGIDAGGSGTCLPQCFLDITQPIVANCITTLPCTKSFNFQTFVLTVCYDNGVKFSTTINGMNSVVTAYKSNGGKCFSLETTPTSQTSTNTNWRNAADQTVARIVVDNVNQANVQKYYCGANGPYTVDLQSAECQAQGTDAGTGTCTDSASCMPP